MTNFRIKISPEALQDIQQATDWYNERGVGLGEKFQKQVKKQIDKLTSNALLYTIRYDDVRCLVIKKFPFMVHFVVDENRGIVDIFAVFHTSRNPKIWIERNQKDL